uniref:Uncharacterized protein n=2 Tax=Ixodes scapularis TaxID=6945 RepID=A0A1S4LZT8_IXOSC
RTAAANRRRSREKERRARANVSAPRGTDPTFSLSLERRLRGPAGSSNRAIEKLPPSPPSCESRYYLHPYTKRRRSTKPVLRLHPSPRLSPRARATFNNFRRFPRFLHKTNKRPVRLRRQQTPPRKESHRRGDEPSSAKPKIISPARRNCRTPAPTTRAARAAEKVASPPRTRGTFVAAAAVAGASSTRDYEMRPSASAHPDGSNPFDIAV